MAAQAVTGDQYRRVHRKQREIMRQLDQDGGYPFDIGQLEKHLQLAVEGEFDVRPIPRSAELCTLPQASAIMGTHFHGPQEAHECFMVEINEELYRGVPFTVEPLRALEATHFLLAVPAISINAMRMQYSHPDRVAAYGRLFCPEHKIESPYALDLDKEPFADEMIAPGWYLVRKYALPGSTNRAWPSQEAMVLYPDYVPPASLITYVCVLRFLTRSERLFDNYRRGGAAVVTSSTTGEGGFHVEVARAHGDNGLMFEAARFSSPSRGVATARRHS